MPGDCLLGPGLDIDLSSCYGTSLKELVYPVGVPTVLSYKPNERRPTLGAFLERWESELVPGLWQVIVSGELPFEQDLLYSTILTPARVAGAARRGELEGHFVLTRREPVNSVITHDLLNALRRVANHAERKALMQLEVVTACFYKASDRRDVDTWIDEVLADGEGTQSRACLDPGERPDARSTLWHGIELRGFIGPLTEEREKLKALARAGDRGAKARDSVLKLLVNTLYGDVASRHHQISNAVLANNITARGRLASWMLAKALGLRQTITDGGIYCPSAVPHWYGKSPGLAILSDLEKWDCPKRKRYWRPLGRRDWPAGEQPDDADAVAAEHVRAFWAPYGLELHFTLAHKKEHAFVKAAYWSKADYALQLADGTRVFKTRGKKEPGPGEKEHPRRILLANLLGGRDDYPRDMTYKKGGILKVGAYQQARQSAGFAWLKDLRPGENIPPREYTARDNNLHGRIRTVAEWRRRHGRKKKYRGRDVQWFEAWGHLGAPRVLARMADDWLPGRGAGSK
jgi:hypothetical protein